MFIKKEKSAELNEESASKLSMKYRILIACGIFLVGIILFVVFKGMFYDLDNNGKPSLLKKMVVIYFGCFAIYSFCVVWDNNLSKVANKLINFHIMEWFPVICFVLVEMTIGTDSNLIIMNFRRLILNVALYMVVFFFFYVVTASIRKSVIAMTVFTVLFAMANIYLLRFRQIPLIATDFLVVRTALNVAGDFSYTPNGYIIVLICVLIAVIVLSGKLVENKELRRKIPFRIIIACIYLVFAGFMYHLTMQTDYLNNKHIKFNTFRPVKSYATNGGLLTFTKSIKLCMIDKPEEYSKKTVDEIARDYPSDSVKNVEDNTQPNVIVIMDEAFADLQSVGNFETNEEVMPFYNNMKENTVKGFTYVSVFGGQTANTEYEFLTGDSKAFLPEGSTPYQLYIKEYMPSLTGNLALDGYQGLLALHPFYATGYNRKSVYEKFGFNEFITMDQFHNPDFVRGFISDEADFDRVISEYEKCKAESDAPFYMFNVTMQNHSSYDKDFANLPKTIKITTEGKSNVEAERYLNLIHLSDKAIEKLINYFENCGEPTVVVLFGDHEPGLSDSFYSKIIGKDLNKMTNQESMELYKTPFFIWANFDIEEEYIDKISINYLQSLMLDKVGLEKTGYNKFLLDMYKEIPVITGNGYFGKDGNYYSLKDTNSPYYDYVKKYNMIEYNHLFDAKNRNSFFEYTK